MAFLSSVTHKMLIGKYQPPTGCAPSSPRHHDPPMGLSDPEDLGITLSGEFLGGIRCMEVYKSGGSAIDKVQVWTGEHDGALCVRDGLGQGRFTIEKKKSVFVTALLWQGYMYAGLSDGYLRVYDQVGVDDGTDYELICETKRHTAAVTCMLGARELIVTGGRDWQIFIWKWDLEGTFRVIDQFWGHQNAVRCLAYDTFGGDRLLYHAGDDCIIRCLELEVGRPRENFHSAKHAHKQGIRALAVFDFNLFSASQDGTVKAWHSQTGEYITTVLRTPNVAVLTLFADPAGGRLWTGGADGIIRVFDIYEHYQICQMEAPHNGSIVTGLSCIGRVVGTKYWLINDSGKCQVWYTESDAVDRLPMNIEREIDLVRRIDMLRPATEAANQMLTKKSLAYALMADSRKELRKKMVTTFGKLRQQDLKQNYMYKLKAWYIGMQNELKRKELAYLLAATNANFLGVLYFHKLHDFHKMRQEARRREQLAHALLGNTNKGLKLIYWSNLKRYVRKEMGRQHKIDLMNTMMRNTEGGMRLVFYSKWARWVFRKRNNAKRDAVASTLMRNATKGTMTVYYNKLLHFFHKERDLASKRRVGEALRASTEKGLRAIYLAKCLRWLRRKRDEKKRKDTAELLMRVSKDGLRRVYTAKIREYMRVRAQMTLQEKLREMDRLIRELDQMLRESGSLSDAEIEQAMRETNEEIDSLNREIAVLEKQLDEILKENAGYEKQLYASDRPDFNIDGSLPMSQQARQLMALIKTHGVNCRDDYRTINELQQKRDSDPSSTFLYGNKKVKDAIHASVTRQGNSCDMSGVRWKAPFDSVSKMEPRLLSAAHQGVKEMVIAMDQMKIGGPHFQKLEKMGTLCQQVVENQDFIIDIVVRVHNERLWKEALQLLTPEQREAMGIRIPEGFTAGPTKSEPASSSTAPQAPSSSKPAAKASATAAALAAPAETRTAPSPQGSEGSTAPKKGTAGIKLADNLSVSAVSAGGPAEKGGLKVGDVVTAVNGTKVKDKKGYAAATKNFKPRQSITLAYMRGPRQKQVVLVLD